MVEKISGAASVSLPSVTSQLARNLHDQMRQLILSLSSVDPSNPDHLAKIAETVVTLHRLSQEAEKC